MTSIHFGAPGIGGSLGQCAICGENYDTLELKGVPQTLYVHPACGDNISEYLGDKWITLPDKSPIRIAFLKHEQQRNEAILPA